MKIATLCFLLKKNENGIDQICLGKKKRGFGVGKWNGLGGKFDPKIDEDIQATARRESLEEVGVAIKDLEKMAEITFRFTSAPEGEEWDQVVHAYIVRTWEGEPTESEEMAPAWFDVNSIPYAEMWPSDSYWLTDVLAGSKLNAEILFDDGTNVISQKKEPVQEFLTS